MAGGYLPLRAPVVVWPYTPCSPALRDRCGRGGIGRRAGFRSRSPLGVEVRVLSPALIFMLLIDFHVRRPTPPASCRPLKGQRLRLRPLPRNSTDVGQQVAILDQ